MSIEKIKELWAEDEMFSLEDYIVEEGDWIDDGKYSYCETIIKMDDKFYSINRSRSGSYFSDYYYNDAEVYEVERKEETKVVVTWPTRGKAVLSLPER